MRDINKILPKIPNMNWGALMNFYPTHAELKKLDRMLPHDHKWHTVLNTPTSTIVDDIPVVKKKAESMT